jgi:hypothetical protein
MGKQGPNIRVLPEQIPPHRSIIIYPERQNQNIIFYKLVLWSNKCISAMACYTSVKAQLTAFKSPIGNDELIQIVDIIVANSISID